MPRMSWTLPAELWARVVKLAQAEHRSVNAEAIVLLERAVADAEAERQATP